MMLSLSLSLSLSPPLSSSLRSDKGNSLQNSKRSLAKTFTEKPADHIKMQDRGESKNKKGVGGKESGDASPRTMPSAVLSFVPFFFLPAALDLIHSGWLHYSYYSASVRSFRSSVA